MPSPSSSGVAASSMAVTFAARGESAASTETSLSFTPTSGHHPGDSGPSNPLHSLVAGAINRSRLRIRLLFLDGELPDQNYSVPANLLVSELHRRVSSLMDVQEPIVLMVSPD